MDRSSPPSSGLPMDAAPAPSPSPAASCKACRQNRTTRKAQHCFRIAVALEFEKFAVRFDRLFEQHVIIGAAYAARPQPFKMRCGELRIEQVKTAGFEARHQMDERHLAGIGLAREHALAEEGATDPDAI